MAFLCLFSCILSIVAAHLLELIFLIPGISRIRINGCRYVYIVGRMQMKELFGRAGFDERGMWPSNNRHWSLCRVLIIIHSWPLLSSLSLFCSVCDWKAHRPEDRSILNRNETTTTIGRDMQIRWYHQIFSFGGIVVVLLPLPLVHSDFGPKNKDRLNLHFFGIFSMSVQGRSNRSIDRRRTTSPDRCLRLGDCALRNFRSTIIVAIIIL